MPQTAFTDLPRELRDMIWSAAALHQLQLVSNYHHPLVITKTQELANIPAVSEANLIPARHTRTVCSVCRELNSLILARIG